MSHEPTRYQKRPIEVEAIRFAEDGSNWIACCRFFQDVDDYTNDDGIPDRLFVRTLHGEVDVLPGDWIIRGPQGDFWPCKPDIFQDSYEPASTPVRACVFPTRNEGE